MLKPILVTNPLGNFASITSADTGCGTADAPWLIRLPQGQRINVTLLDFSIAEANNSSLAVGNVWQTTGGGSGSETGGDARLDGGSGNPSVVGSGKHPEGGFSQPDANSLPLNKDISVGSGSNFNGSKLASVRNSSSAPDLFRSVISDNEIGDTGTHPPIVRDLRNGSGTQTGPGGSGGLDMGEGLSKMCRVYAILRESNGARSTTLCGGETRRRTAYITLANSVEIRVIMGRTAKHVVSFMLQYKGI